MIAGFTFEESNLIYMYDTSAKKKLIAEIGRMRMFLDVEQDKEMYQLACSVLSKLGRMSDEEYNGLELGNGEYEEGENGND